MSLHPRHECDGTRAKTDPLNIDFTGPAPALNLSYCGATYTTLLFTLSRILFNLNTWQLSVCWETLSRTPHPLPRPQRVAGLFRDTKHYCRKGSELAWSSIMFMAFTEFLLRQCPILSIENRYLSIISHTSYRPTIGTYLPIRNLVKINPSLRARKRQQKIINICLLDLTISVAFLFSLFHQPTYPHFLFSRLYTFEPGKETSNLLPTLSFSFCLHSVVVHFSSSSLTSSPSHKQSTKHKAQHHHVPFHSTNHHHHHHHLPARSPVRKPQTLPDI